MLLTFNPEHTATIRRKKDVETKAMKEVRHETEYKVSDKRCFSRVKGFCQDHNRQNQLKQMAGSKRQI